MTFPVVESISSVEDASYSGNTFDIAMPTGVQAGDLLIVAASKNVTCTGVADGSENWTAEHEAGGYPPSVFTKIATGNESSTITLTWSSQSDANSAVAYRISGWKGDSLANDIEWSRLWNPNTATKSFNSHSLVGWSDEDTLWLAAMGAEDDATVISTWGANIPDNRIDAGAGAASNLRNVVAFATAESAANSFTPDTCTINTADDGYSITFAIRPGAAPPAGGWATGGLARSGGLAGRGGLAGIGGGLAG